MGSRSYTLAARRRAIDRPGKPYYGAAYLADFDARLAEGLHVVGSPDTVKQQVQEHLQITGSNYFVGSFCFGTLTSEQTLRWRDCVGAGRLRPSLRLFAEEVMPACRHTG